MIGNKKGKSMKEKNNKDNFQCVFPSINISAAKEEKRVRVYEA